MFLDFNQISQAVLFRDLLDFLNIPYTESKTELRGEVKELKFIVNKNKNLFFSPNLKEARGSVINFLSYLHLVDLREAAEFLKTNFLKEAKEPKREIPELELLYTKEVEKLGITEELAKEFEVGMIKQKSVMAGKIAFKLYDENNNKVGYIGKEVKKDGWFFPKGFKRDIVYNLYRRASDYAILVVSPLDVLYLHSLGFTYSLALLGKSATDGQIDLLKTFKRIMLFHPEPDNIILRLSQYCFIKAITLNSVRELSSEEIKKYF